MVAVSILPHPLLKDKGKKACLDMQKTSSFNQISVDVEFSEDLAVDRVVTYLSQEINPNVILWYIGCYGLKKIGVQFYKDFLISPCFKKNSNIKFWLIDLTAWNAFRNSQSSIFDFNSCCDVIEKISDKKIECIKSATIFKKMQEISGEKLVDYFKSALKRNFIRQTSEKFPNINICTDTVFLGNCEVLSEWYNSDVSKSYSIAQYLEGCLLVDEIFLRLANSKVSDMQIIFALPNDELKYYRDEQNSFQKDISFLIVKRCLELNIKNIQVKVKFFGFKYGNEIYERPYNAPGKAIKKNKLSPGDVFENFGEQLNFCKR